MLSFSFFLFFFFFLKIRYDTVSAFFWRIDLLFVFSFFLSECTSSPMKLALCFFFLVAQVWQPVTIKNGMDYRLFDKILFWFRVSNCHKFRVLYPGFSLNRPQGRFSHRVAMSVCVCLWQFKTPSSGGRTDFWSKGLSLILACDDTFFFFFFLCFDEFSCLVIFLGFRRQPIVSQLL